MFDRPPLTGKLAARQRAIDKFTRLEYYGVYGIRLVYDIPGMIKAGLLDDELKGARMLADRLKREKSLKRGKK